MNKFADGAIFYITVRNGFDNHGKVFERIKLKSGHIDFRSGTSTWVWWSELQSVLNEAKTKIIIQFDSKFTFVFSPSEVDRIKILGVIMDKKMNFQEQMEGALKTISSNVYLIKGMKHIGMMKIDWSYV